MIENLLIILSFNFIVITILWLSSLKTRRADFIDIYWGPSFFFSTAIIYFLDNDYSLPKIIALSLVGLWGLRLGIYLFSRNIRKSEDIRYVKIREYRGDFGLFYTAYLIQVILICIVSFPMQSLSMAPNNLDLNLFGVIAIIIALLGIIIETISDIQLTKFKSEKNNKDKLMDKGLWFYSRHPNYFGDSVFWWGISLFCFSISYNLLIFISPIIMTYLLLKVSGVSLLEKTIAKKKEGYDDYIKSTSSFIILPKKNIK